MTFFPMLLVAAAAFGLCFGIDKLFTKAFRGTQLHKSGKSVRLNKHYGGFGLVMVVFGTAAILAGDHWLMPAGGALILLLGVGLIVYYMTFGIFYDADEFVLTTFGKKSKTYRYSQITAQQLYLSGGNIIVELYLDDGRAVQLHQRMSDSEAFLDGAFAAWCRQKGIDPASCAFHDRDNSCWFPAVEG